MKNPSENKEIIPIIDENKKKLSKLENLFNNRIKHIKDLKETINLARKQIQWYHQESNVKIFPITQEITNKEILLVNSLVKAFDENVLKEKKQIRDFKKLLIFFIEDLIFEKQQKDLDKLYERFAGKTIEKTKEETEQEERQKLIQIIDTLGLKLTEEEREKLLLKDSNLDFINEIKARLYEDKRGKPHKKSKKKLRKEEKQNQELENISAIVKQVYKELMKALHPDKELNESKIVEKTTLVQQITEAYRNDDLFTLLSIKFIWLDNADTTSLGDDKIEYFNKMLLKQVQELEEQKRQIGFSLKIHPVLINFLGKAEFDKFSKRIIEQTQKEVEKKLQDINSQIERIEIKDKKHIKRFVNEQYKLLIEDKTENY